MAKGIMIQGTMSSAGKSYIVTGLCRYYARQGYRVAPFKSQNMALNSYVTKDGLEMGRAQVVQAEAAGKEPSVYMNPILLKPTTDVGSQVIVEGKSIGNIRAKEYFAYKTKLIPNILSAYNKLAQDNDIIIIEGAGSPAEINLKENDIVNMGLAKLLDVPVVLVGDIDPGGVFAQLYGTIELLPDDEKDLIKGLIINKFRGDVELLRPGLKMLEDKCGKRVLGVVPMSNVKIDEEDSITSAFSKELMADADIDIAIIKLPRISNFTDFSPLCGVNGVSVRYVTSPIELGTPDLIIIPGSKSTITDLRWLKQSGLFDMIHGLSRDIPVLGICGGYQMLGLKILDPEGIEGGGEENGLELLPMITTLDSTKTTRQVEGVLNGIEGAFSFLNGRSYVGYEIHNGKSEYVSEDKCGNVFGSYIHGLFDKSDVTRAVVEYLYSRRGMSFSDVDKISDMKDRKNLQYDLLADSLSQAIDFDELNRIIGI